jgi:S-adenosylmethionine:tRNA ribosyltransferase-isomerase
MKQTIFIEEYDYPLPHERIAAFPLTERDQSKLLVYKSGKIKDDTFYHLPDNTKVIEARLHFQKATGGVIEIFCLEPYQPAEMAQAMQQTATVQWRCLIGGASKWKPGQLLQKPIFIGNETITLHARYIAKEEDSFIIAFEWEGQFPFAEVLHEAGAIPLPPYIKRKAEAADADRYQTVFAEHKGSVAAPTAALHFTPKVFEALQTKAIQPTYVTLHVGAGTFKPVKTETIAEHQMHAEHFSVSPATLQALIKATTITAVGTTSLRTLESLHWLGVKLLLNDSLNDFILDQWEAYDLEHHAFTYKESLGALYQYLQQNNREQLWCKTSLLIMPGYRFRSANALVTNFHQPKSTLLLLVAAFIGDNWTKVYEHALQNEYRFLSYGDSSLLFRSQPVEEKI